MPPSVTPDDEEGGQAYGKSVSELQSGIRIVNGTVTGTLHYVKGYDQFSSNTDEQDGNFLSLKVNAQEGATLYYELVGAKKKPGKFKFEDGDHQLVCRITDKNRQRITITAELNGETKTTTYSLTGLTLEVDKG